MALFVKKKNIYADSFNSPCLVLSLHPSLKIPRTHWYVALFEVVGETEIQVLPVRKWVRPTGSRKGGYPRPAIFRISLQSYQLWWGVVWSLSGGTLGSPCW